MVEPNPKKRRVLSVEEKVNVIKQIESGLKKADVSKHFGLVNSTVQGIWQNRHKIIRAYEENGSQLKRLRKPERSDVDQALLKWYKEQRLMPGIINGRILRAKAEELAKLLLNDKDFECTKSWLDRFKMRHKISFSGRIYSASERSSGESSQWNADEAEEESSAEDEEEDESVHTSMEVEDEEEVERDHEKVDERHSEPEVATEEDNQSEQSEHSNTDTSSVSSSCSSSDDDVVEIERPPPTLYDAVNAIRTIARFYSTQDETPKILSAIKGIEDDLEQSCWNIFRQTMALVNDESNHDDTSEDES